LQFISRIIKFCLYLLHTLHTNIKLCRAWCRRRIFRACTWPDVVFWRWRHRRWLPAASREWVRWRVPSCRRRPWQTGARWSSFPTCGVASSRPAPECCRTPRPRRRPARRRSIAPRPGRDGRRRRPPTRTRWRRRPAMTTTWSRRTAPLPCCNACRDVATVRQSGAELVVRHWLAFHSSCVVSHTDHVCCCCCCCRGAASMRSVVRHCACSHPRRSLLGLGGNVHYCAAAVRPATQLLGHCYYVDGCLAPMRQTKISLGPCHSSSVRRDS